MFFVAPKTTITCRHFWGLKKMVGAVFFFSSLLVWSQLLSRPTLLPMLSVFCFCLYSLSCTFLISLIFLTSSMNISTSWLPHIINNNTKTTVFFQNTLGFTTQINLGNVTVLRQADASIDLSYPIFNVFLEASLTQGRTRYIYSIVRSWFTASNACPMC